MPTTVAVSVVRDPEGRPAVLLELEYGWVTLLPKDATEVVAMILTAVAEIVTTNDR